MKFGNQLCELCTAGGVVASPCSVAQFMDGVLKHFAVGHARRCKVNRGVAGRRKAFGIMEQFFIEFLTGPQADKLDVDILIGAFSGEADDLLGEVCDPDRFTHIQNENAAGIC